jgi:predicted DNA-binding WGR domain protein
MTTSIYLEKRIPARNQKRFYTIMVTRTRFDGWTLVREWGRIGQGGTVREMEFETEGEAIEAGMKVRQRKVKRGYRAVGGYQKHRQ